jgi:hypothetical protein
VVAQAGIAPLGGNPPMQAWNHVIDTNPDPTLTDFLLCVVC